MILISGPTGNVGREIVKQLIQKGIHFRAMVRDEKQVDPLLHHPLVEPVHADFDEPDSLVQALKGVNRAFLLTPSLANAEIRQCHFVEAAARAGVAHIVKQSQLHANLQSPVRFLRYHAHVEDTIRRSGLHWTFLRPNLFMQGFLMFKQSIAQDGSFAIAAGAARVSAVDVRDIAAVAIAALTEAGHTGRIYDLTGPEALTHADMAAELSHALGKPVRYVDLDEKTMHKMLAAHGMPAWMADGLVEDYAHYRRGEAQDIADGVQIATGNTPRSFATFARDYAGALNPSAASRTPVAPVMQ